MKRIAILALLATLTAGCGAHHMNPPWVGPLEATPAPAPKAHTPLDVAHTASVVGFRLHKRLVAFIFISKDGKHLNVSTDQCAQSSKCQDMMKQLGDAGQTDLIDLQEPKEGADEDAQNGGTSAPDDPHDLPHRPLHEIDIQGHQPSLQLDNPCPGGREPLRIADDDGTPLFVLCFAH